MSTTDPFKLRELRERVLSHRRELAERMGDDALRSWEPHEKQRPFVRAVLDYEAPEVWLIGANRSGKSDVGAYCGATLARYGPPDKLVRSSFAGSGKDSIEVRDRATSGWVVGLDHNIIRDTVQPKYFDNGYVPPGAPNKPFIPQREISGWDRENNIIKLKCGSLVGFKSAESGAAKFQGAGKDWVHYDEVPPKPVYDECGIRVEAGRRLLQFGTCTLLPPEGGIGGVAWLYHERIRPFKQGTLKNCLLFSASMYDNPHLSPEEIAIQETKYPIDTPMGQIRILGSWLPGIGGARAYSSFLADTQVQPQPQPQPYAPLCWTWDFNVDPLVSVVGWKDGPRFRVCAEHILEDSGNIPDMCELFYRHWGHHQGEVRLYGDATGGNRTAQTARSSFTMILQEMSRYQMRLRLCVPDKNPFVTDRLNAVNRACSPSGGGEPLLLVDPACTELIDDLEQVLLDANGGIRKITNRRDPYFRRTHISDALGYWVSYDAPVRLARTKDQWRPGAHNTMGGRIKGPGYSFNRAR